MDFGIIKPLAGQLSILERFCTPPLPPWDISGRDCFRVSGQARLICCQLLLLQVCACGKAQSHSGLSWFDCELDIIGCRNSLV